MSNTFGIVAKYELIKHRIAYGEENVTSYELEAKIQALHPVSISRMMIIGAVNSTGLRFGWC